MKLFSTTLVIIYPDFEKNFKKDEFFKVIPCNSLVSPLPNVRRKVKHKIRFNYRMGMFVNTSVRFNILSLSLGPL